MAIIYNGTELTRLTYNDTNVTEVWVCDTSTASCTKVFPDPAVVTFNYLAVDTDLSSLNRSADVSVYGILGCRTGSCNCNNLYFSSTTGPAVLTMCYNTTLSVTLQDETPVCTGTCGIYDYCIWTANDFKSACLCVDVYEYRVCSPYNCCRHPSCSYSISPTNATITSATYSVNTSICVCCLVLGLANYVICCLCGAGTVTSNPSITRTVSYCVTNTITGETRRNFSGIENEESSINFTFDF